MPFYDLTPAELATYDAQLPVPADLERFWDETLSEARTYDLAAQFTQVQTPLSAVEVYDVTFAGWGGHPSRVGCWCPYTAPEGCRASCSTSATPPGVVIPTSG